MYQSVIEAYRNCQFVPDWRRHRQSAFRLHLPPSREIAFAGACNFSSALGAWRALTDWFCWCSGPTRWSDMNDGFRKRRSPIGEALRSATSLKQSVTSARLLSVGTPDGLAAGWHGSSTGTRFACVAKDDWASIANGQPNEITRGKQHAARPSCLSLALKFLLDSTFPWAFLTFNNLILIIGASYLALWCVMFYSMVLNERPKNWLSSETHGCEIWDGSPEPACASNPWRCLRGGRGGRATGHRAGAAAVAQVAGGGAAWIMGASIAQPISQMKRRSTAGRGERCH